MSTYKPIDSKREEFRKYLERAGVMDALTKVLVMLYEEPDKPEDALEFVRMNLGDKRPAMSEMEALKTELDGALFRVKELEEELSALRGGGGGGAGAEFGRSSLHNTEGAAPPGPADTTTEREV